MFQKVFISLLAVLLAPVLSANSVGFQIEDFIPDQFDDLRWRVGGDFNLSNSSSSSNYEESTYNFRDQNSFSVGSGAFSSLVYERLSKDRNLIYTLNSSFELNYSDSDDKTDQSYYYGYDYYYRENDYNNSSVYFNISPSVSYDKYLKSDLFLGLDLSASFRYNTTLQHKENQYYYNENTVSSYTSVEESQSNNELENDNKYYQISASPTFGWGRKYVGLYGTTAIYMIDELKKNGILLNSPTDEQMIKLSELIYYYHNKHAVDARLLRIETFEEIANFLIEKKIISDKDVRTILTIQDVYDYFPNNNRYFGWTVEINPGITYMCRSSQNSQDMLRDLSNIEIDINSGDTVVVESYEDSRYQSYYKYRSEELESFLNFTFEYHKPINFKWQFDSYFRVNYALQHYSEGDDFHSYIYDDTLYTTNKYYSFYDYEKDYSIQFSNYLTYFKSSRTSLSSNMVVGYTQYRTHVEYYDRIDDDENFSISVGSSLEYRIAIPTTLNVSASYSYRFNSDESTDALDYENDNNRFSLDASIEHYIF